jgi:hypothetical protein
MTCFTCNALIPDGAQTCPRCGAKIAAPGAQGNNTSQWSNAPGQAPVNQWSNMPAQAPASPWSNMAGQSYNRVNEQRRFLLESSDAIKKVFFLRLGYTISYAVSFVLALLAYFSPAFLLQHKFVANTLPNILIGINIIITILLLIVFSDLKNYEERFGKALAYGAVTIMFSASQFFNITNQTLALLIAVTSAICGILFMYHYCGSFSDLTESVDEGISRKWELLLRIYLGATLLHIASLLYLYFAIRNASSLYKLLTLADRTVLFAFILAAIDFVILVFEVIIISKTYKSFEEERQY